MRQKEASPKRKDLRERAFHLFRLRRWRGVLFHADQMPLVSEESPLNLVETESDTEQFAMIFHPYSYDSKAKYSDYLRRNESDLVRGEIAESTRKILGSNQDLLKIGKAIVLSQTNTVGAVSQGLEFAATKVAEGLNRVSTQLRDIQATFEWGFSEMLFALSEVSESLDALVLIAKTPSQTWAYEQFDMGRDAYRKCLMEEAIEHIERAINGHGDHTGYKLEYRFHWV